MGSFPNPWWCFQITVILAYNGHFGRKYRSFCRLTNGHFGRKFNGHFGHTTVILVKNNGHFGTG